MPARRRYVKPTAHLDLAHFCDRLRRDPDAESTDYGSATTLGITPTMYVDHFGLSARAFVNAPDTNFFLPNAQVEAAIARLCEVMLARDSIAVVTGGPGVGKSAFVAAAGAVVEAEAVIVSADLRYTDSDLLTDMLLLGLGAQAGDANEAESLHRLKIRVREHHVQGQSVTAVIGVSGMTVECAKQLIRLAHLAGEPGGQLNIVLTGPHTLHRLLNAPGMIHLRQRVCFQHRVRPLDLSETHAYIERQFERAGSDAGSILENNAARTVFRFVGGVPRLINTLMQSVLSAAAIGHVDRIGPELIEQVARELGWKPLVSGQPQAPRAAAAPRPASEVPGTTDKSADNAGAFPEMSASDTSATGMLRLEDLDARFAETIFGEDATTSVTNALGASRPQIPEQTES